MLYLFYLFSCFFMFTIKSLREIEQNIAIAEKWQALEEWQKWEPITENSYFNYAIALIIKGLLTHQEYPHELWELLIRGVNEFFEEDSDALLTEEEIVKWIKKQNIPL